MDNGITEEELKAAFDAAESDWCDAWERLRSAEEMRDLMLETMGKKISELYQEVDRAHDIMIAANDRYQEAVERAKKE